MEKTRCARRAAMISIACATSAIFCAACALVLDIQPVPDGKLDGATLEDAALDARADLGDAGSVSDASDAKNVIDASNDGARPFRCADLSPPPLLCDDFDEGRPLGFGWSENRTKGGSLSLDDAASRSPPTSLLGSVTVPTNSASLVRSTTMPASSVHLEFDMRVDEWDSSPTADPNALACAASLYWGPNEDRAVRLLAFNGHAQMERVLPDGGPEYTQYPMAGLLQPLTWTHVTIDVANANGTATCTAYLDGGLSLDHQPLGPWPTSPPTLAIGTLFTVNTSARWTLRFDNVVFDAK